MRINKFKNLIGLCACKGCFKPFKVKIEVKGEKEGVQVNKISFSICEECVFKLFE